MQYFSIKACFPFTFSPALKTNTHHKTQNQPKAKQTPPTTKMTENPTTEEQKLPNGEDYFLKIRLVCYLNVDSMIQLLRQCCFAAVMVTEGSVLL